MNPLELLYYTGYRFDTWLKTGTSRRLERPVISVGNITAGGTGKTPACIALALEARKRGLSPCVLTRGYRGRIKGPVRISEELYEEDVGDEALLMKESLGEIPIIKGADRYASGLFAIESLKEDPRLFLLDDGFQHRRLERDIDIVLINSRNPFHNGRLLPMGRLREPLEALERAHIFAFTKCRNLEQEHEEATIIIRRHNAIAPIFNTMHTPTFIRRFNGKGYRKSYTEPVEWIAGKRVMAFCGIADPESFNSTLVKAGAEVLGIVSFSDHHRFSMHDIDRVQKKAEQSGADWIITTEKDIMRLRKRIKFPEHLLSLGLGFVAPGEFYDTVFGMLERK